MYVLFALILSWITGWWDWKCLEGGEAFAWVAACAFPEFSPPIGGRGGMSFPSS